MWILDLIDLLKFTKQIERAKEQIKIEFDVNEFKDFCNYISKNKELRRSNNAHSKSR